MMIRLHALFSTLLLTIGAFAQTAPPQTSLPLFFVPNAGQFGPASDFGMSTNSVTVLFEPSAVSYSLKDGASFRIRYLTPDSVHAVGVQPLVAKVNYLVGSHEETWKRDLPTYASVTYRSVWPGVDVVYSTATDVFKSEFQIAPEADLKQIQWKLEGTATASIEDDGSLLIKAGSSLVREAPPQIYEIDRDSHQHHTVTGGFRLLPNGAIGIEVAGFDPKNILIFDPMIYYSTYVGGYGQSAATAVKVDAYGSAVIAGWTTSADFTSPTSLLGVSGRTDAYVAKFNVWGQFLFCTYLGGSLNDQATGLALDGSGNIFVAGFTSSTNFPVRGALQPTLHGSRDAFITELNSAGNAIVFSTYFGGSGLDQANAIALDNSGNIYVTGDTQSLDMPVYQAIQQYPGGGQDAFILKLNPSGAYILYSTYFGGHGDEHAAGIAVDSLERPCIVGSTFSNNFPLTNAFQPQSGGNQDAFVTKLTAPGNSLIFSTYLGGSNGIAGLPEGATAVAMDPSGGEYVTGTTSSANFPVTPGAYQLFAPGGTVDAFVTRFDTNGLMVYSTYLGGSGPDYANAIAVDSVGNASVVGYTWSSDFPSVRGLQNGNRGATDIFLTKLNPWGTALIYSTLLGGSSSDDALGIALDAYGAAVVVGQTMSTDLPLVSANKNFLPGTQSSFLMRIPVGWKLVTVTSPFMWWVDLLSSSGSNGQGAYAYSNLYYGQPGDIPILGDWNHTGVKSMGIFRNGTWVLDSNGSGGWDAGDRTFVFGQAGDIPLAGDWTGTGRTTVGLFRNGTFILDYSGHTTGIPTGQNDLIFTYGQAGDVPVVGDWNGSGTAKIGVFRNGYWFLDSNGDHLYQGSDLMYFYGSPGDQPVTGDWDGSGITRIGVYHTPCYYLDYNGNGIQDVGSGDLQMSFGPNALFALIGR